MVNKIIEEVKTELIAILDNLSAPHASITYIEYEAMFLIHEKLSENGMDPKSKINENNVDSFIMNSVVNHLQDIQRCK